MTERYEAVIGLEVHVQLATRTKLFCADRVEFGATPNRHVCPVCLGLPGALPVLNGAAVELAVRAALGLGCEVQERSVFARKNYFYPDLPRGYQITQHDHPLALGGFLDLPADGKGGAAERVRLRRIHLEEDSGKSLHDRVPGATAIDLNRAGVPLIEIVTEPEIGSPAQARRFLGALRQVLLYLGVSGCSMEAGELRVDVNVSIRRAGEERLGTRTEIKNLNSFGGVERALRFEVGRQERQVRAGRPVRHETLLWDDLRREARPQRSKEELHDYRYFAEPDLSPLRIDRRRIAEIRARLPELPAYRRERFQREYGVAAAHAEVLTGTRELADYYEAVVTHPAVAPAAAASWVLGDVLAALNAVGGAITGFPVSPSALAGLLAIEAEGALSRPVARQVFARMVETGEPAARIIEREGLATVESPEAISAWVEAVLRENPEEVARFRAGDTRLLGWFVGQVMRRSGGGADPGRVNALLRDALDG